MLLCVQIVLLGVCISPSPAGGDQYEQLSLQPMPLYSLPSDNVIMTCVASSAAGRLFMGGSDGNLYEIQYEATDTWWQRRCSKVCSSCCLVACTAAHGCNSSRTTILLGASGSIQHCQDRACICAGECNVC